SVPMLVISSVNRREALGMGAGDLHEVRNPGLMAAQAAAFSHMLTHPSQLPEVLARAWSVFESARPRPVHIQIPLEMLSEPMPETSFVRPAPVSLPEPSSTALEQAANTLTRASHPLILAGGGCSDGTALIQLAEALDAPVVMTVNARGLIPPEHPLGLATSPTLSSVRDAIRAADVVLALGTEIGRTDYDMNDQSPVEVDETLIRVDIDPNQMMLNAVPDQAIVGDADAAIRRLLERIKTPLTLGGADRAAKIRNAASDEIGPDYRSLIGFLNVIRDTLPEAAIFGDSTNAIYAGNMAYNAQAPRQYYNAATGYGALGYGLPAAIGATKGLGAPVVCIAGDGGVQFSLTDLGTAVEEQLPTILIVINNQGYGEIKHWMERAQIRPVGVDLHTPDFVTIGRAYGAEALNLTDLAELPAVLRTAAARSGPTLIEIDEASLLAH
ncbi:MAG: 5-guanidino-2-oxopentanoate decarboxylase, partial [Pseudomonadota bacterium]